MLLVLTKFVCSSFCQRSDQGILCYYFTGCSRSPQPTVARGNPQVVEIIWRSFDDMHGCLHRTHKESARRCTQGE